MPEDPYADPVTGMLRNKLAADLLAHHPRDRHALFAYASALDFAGREADAAPAYERAFAADLEGDDLRQGLVQYESTLRNLRRFDDAVTALRQADDQFPGQASVKAFLALALTSADRCHEAVQILSRPEQERDNSDKTTQTISPENEPHAAPLSD